MSKRSIAEITKQWRTRFQLKKDKSTPSELRQLVNQTPESLRAKLAVSPYARILASPLRQCTFHGRLFPSKLLLRFGQAYHGPTNSIWAYPTFKKSQGKGVYVDLSKKVLEIFSKGSFRAAFRGAALYRSDMTEHVEHALFKESWQLFSRLPVTKYPVLQKTIDEQWISDEYKEFQCILRFDQDQSAPLCHINQANIPCYNMQLIWSQSDIASIQKSQPFALGVPKSLDTIELSIALWRCRQFLE